MRLFFRNHLLVLALGMVFVAGCGQKAAVTTTNGTDSKAGPVNEIIVEPTADVPGETQPQQEPVVVSATDNQAQPVAVENNTASASGDGGVLSVDKEVFDFGILEPGGVTNGSYILKNTGTGVLKIDRVTAPCRCTVPDLPKNELAPGESVELKFAFDIGTAYGKVTKKIILTTVSPSTPATLTLSFNAEIRKVLDIQPEGVTFGLKSDYNNKATLVVSSTDDTEFHITGFLCNGDAAVVTYDPAVSAKEHKLTVEGNIANLRNVPTGLITIKTDHPKVDRLTVRYDTKMPFDAFPKTKRFTPETEAGRQAKIKVVSNFAEDFQLGDITSKSGYIKVLDTRKSVDGYEITVELDMTKIGDQETAKKYVSDYLLIPIVGHAEDTLEVHCYGLVN